MIDGARRFAVRWLLEPIYSSEEKIYVRYELEIELVDVTLQSYTFCVENSKSLFHETAVKTFDTTPQTSPCLRIHVYGIDTTQTKDYLGAFDCYQIYHSDIADENTPNQSLGYIIIPGTYFLYYIRTVPIIKEIIYNGWPTSTSYTETTTIPGEVTHSSFYSYKDGYPSISNGTLKLSKMAHDAYDVPSVRVYDDGTTKVLTDTIREYTGGLSIDLSDLTRNDASANYDEFQYFGSIVSKEEWASINTIGDYFKCLNGLTFEKLVKIAVETNNFSSKTSVYYKKEENNP